MSLAPPNIRQPGPDQDAIPEDVEVLLDDAMGGDQPDMDDAGNVLQIEHGDGSITLNITGDPVETADNDNGGWFGNLAEKIDQQELSRIADDLLRDIDNDQESRKQWIEARRQGIQLLGLKVEIPGLQGASDGAPVEGMSKVRHPLLLEAVLRFQANARSELLPTDGPIKVRIDTTTSAPDTDKLADALEMDMNHFLTVRASEYYPDTDRMLFLLGFGGTAFKKVYFCPLRNRPVSESINADDLIVSDSATDLKNAKRVTHRIMMRPATVKRLQILNVYRDISLTLPNAPKLDSLKREEAAQQGVDPEALRPEDRDREIYECYCDLDIKGFEHKYRGKISGLEIPYRVTVDVSSREVLSLVRNYDEETRELPEARTTVVKYSFVPGLGFYDIGLLHILGNTTNALTAATREMLDNGMYANFPGFLISKAAGRQDTNLFRIPPGGAAQVNTGGLPIKDAVMPMPYNTAQMGPLMELVEAMEQNGQRVGGTAELSVGEGKQDAPVGTTLALIEQATKVLDSVHKRLHAAQSEEFRLLVECFKEHPESFYEHRSPSGTNWDEQMFLQALDDHDLTPQADPNTASHSQRIMKVVGLMQLASQAPEEFNKRAVATEGLRALKWDNPDQFLTPAEAQNQLPPQVQKMLADAQNAKTTADARMMDAQTDAKELDAKIQQGTFAPKAGLGGAQQQDTPVDQMLAQAKLMEAQTDRDELGLKHQDMATENQNRDLDRTSKEHMAVLDFVGKTMSHPQEAPHAEQQIPSLNKDVGAG